jgi:O-antigen ligase
MMKGMQPETLTRLAFARRQAVSAPSFAKLQPAVDRRLHTGSLLLCLVLLSLVLGPVPIRVAGRSPNLFLGDVLLAMAAAYAVAHRRAPQSPDRMIRSAVAWMGLYCAAVLATLPMAIDLLRSAAYLKLYLLPFFAFVTAIRLFRSPSDLDRVLLTCAVVGLGLSIGALFTWSLYQSNTLRLASTLGAKDMVQMAGTRSNTVAGTAALLIPGALFAFWHKNLGWRAVGLAALVGLCGTITFSMSRGAIASGVLGFGLSLVHRPALRPAHQGWKAMKAAFALAACGCLSWLLFPSDLQRTFLSRLERERLEITEAPANNDRINRWGVLIEQGLKNPVGVGVGNYEHVSAAAGRKMGGSAHNLYLETLNEAGWLALIALVVCLARILRAITRLRRLARSERFADALTAVIMLFWVFVINVAVEPNYFSGPFTYLFWITMGTAVAAGRTVRSGRRVPGLAPGPSRTTCIAVHG